MVMDGLSRMINDAKGRGLLEGIGVARDRNITHTLFLDDVIIFGNNSYVEWRRYYDIFNMFCRASSMVISAAKSSFISLTDHIDYRVQGLFPFHSSTLEEGFKYLGFTLKPNCYEIMESRWLLTRIDQKIGKQSNRWLSIGGRLMLAKASLEGLLVDWISLYKFPRTIMHGIKKRLCSFIWSGPRDDNKYHLEIWDSLSRPKSMEGWGLLNLDIFSMALRLKGLWRIMFDDNPWSIIMRYKYLQALHIQSWIIGETRVVHGASIIWQRFHEVKSWLRQGIGRLVGNG